MKIFEAEFIKGFIRIIDDGWKQGWHECHGGNITYRLKPQEVESIYEQLDFGDAWNKLNMDIANLKNEFFLVTASGSFFRNVTIEPEKNFGIVEINEEGNAYRCVWGFADAGKPTSEFPSHLMNHDVKKRVSNGKRRVVYHAHPANINTLSFVLPLDDVIMTRELWEMEPECAMTFPNGLGVLPWMVPGTMEIAKRTCEKMEEYDAVLWAQHGIFAAGDTFDNTFGLIHTIEKAAEMLVKTMSISHIKRQVPSIQDFRDMAKEFNLNLPEKFLYEKY